MSEELIARMGKVSEAITHPYKHIYLTTVFDTVEPPSEVFHIIYESKAYYAQLFSNKVKIEEYHRFIIKEIV